MANAQNIPGHDEFFFLHEDMNVPLIDPISAKHAQILEEAYDHHGNHEKQEISSKESAVVPLSNPISQIIPSRPQYAGPIKINVKTKIQTNRRTNVYLQADWPSQMVNKRLPVFYYPPIEGSYSHVLSDIEDPNKIWLTELTHASSTTNQCYLEVQFWLRTHTNRKTIITRCSSHPSTVKLPGTAFDDKTQKVISHDEVKWTRDSIMIFGINFNCTRTCFKTDMYVFVRARFGNLYLESQLEELPFRSGDKRKLSELELPDPTPNKKPFEVPEIPAMPYVPFSSQRRNESCFTSSHFCF